MCHFLQSATGCRLGSSCEFAHSELELSSSQMELSSDWGNFARSWRGEQKACFNFGKGKCKHGARCVFSHGLVEQCDGWSRGTCRLGAKCIFAHEVGSYNSKWYVSLPLPAAPEQPKAQKRKTSPVTIEDSDGDSDTEVSEIVNPGEKSMRHSLGPAETGIQSPMHTVKVMFAHTGHHGDGESCASDRKTKQKFVTIGSRILPAPPPPKRRLVWTEEQDAVTCL